MNDRKDTKMNDRNDNKIEVCALRDGFVVKENGVKIVKCSKEINALIIRAVLINDINDIESSERTVLALKNYLRRNPGEITTKNEVIIDSKYSALREEMEDLLGIL